MPGMGPVSVLGNIETAGEAASGDEISRAHMKYEISRAHRDPVAHAPLPRPQI